VLRELLKIGEFSLDRFNLKDMRIYNESPLNDSVENRARNRRVELIVLPSLTAVKEKINDFKTNTRMTI
tara:strand:- start:81272 stop:81478 length:207 start_codon:yes stop_codon:yes gene_type:complete